MLTEAESGNKAIPAAAGVAVGVLIFVGLATWFGMPFIPTVADLPTYPKPDNDLTRKWVEQHSAQASGPMKPGEETFKTVCATCHQADAKGLPGAFPPLAGSTWLNQDPETPIRIVLAGLSGPITVSGNSFNATMPPPPGLDDEKIAAVLTYVRSNFGNTGAAVDKAKVAEIRAALAGRAKNWSADELSTLRPK